jgi:hypothetical protein
MSKQVEATNPETNVFKALLTIKFPKMDWTSLWNFLSSRHKIISHSLAENTSTLSIQKYVKIYKSEFAFNEGTLG